LSVKLNLKSCAKTRLFKYSFFLVAIPLHSQKLTVKEKDGLYSFFEKKKMVIDFQYDTISEFSNGWYGVGKQGRWGLVSADGKETIPCKYDSYRSCENKLIIASYEGLEGVIDRVDGIVIDFLFDQIDHVKDTQALVKYKGAWCIYHNGLLDYEEAKFIFYSPEKTAQFPGCKQTSLPWLEFQQCSEEKLYKYFSENIPYPIEARRKGIEGQVFFMFIVTQRGEIQNPFILRDLEGGCNEELLRIISGMPA